MSLVVSKRLESVLQLSVSPAYCSGCYAISYLLMCLNISRWKCYNALVASMEVLPNFLCYETGPVKLVLSLQETMASYRRNVDPPNLLG